MPEFEKPSENQKQVVNQLSEQAGYRFLKEAETACFGKRMRGRYGMDSYRTKILIVWLKNQIDEKFINHLEAEKIVKANHEKGEGKLK